MAISENARSAEAIRRKLRSIAAVLLDPAATEHERANAETLKMRLEKQLRQEASARNFCRFADPLTEILRNGARGVAGAGRRGGGCGSCELPCRQADK